MIPIQKIPRFIPHTNPTPPDQSDVTGQDFFQIRMNLTPQDHSDRLFPPHNPSVVGSIPTGPTRLGEDSLEPREDRLMSFGIQTSASLVVASARCRDDFGERAFVFFEDVVGVCRVDEGDVVLPDSCLLKWFAVEGGVDLEILAADQNESW